MVDEGNPMGKSDDGSRAYSLCAAKLSSASAYIVYRWHVMRLMAAAEISAEMEQKIHLILLATY